MHGGALAGIQFDKIVTSAVASRPLFMCVLPGKIIKYGFWVAIRLNFPI